LAEAHEILREDRSDLLKQECAQMLSRLQDRNVGVLAAFQGFVLEGEVLCGAYIESGAEKGLPRVLVGMLKKYLEGANIQPADSAQNQVAIRELDALLTKLRFIDLEPGSATLS